MAADDDAAAEEEDSAAAKKKKKKQKQKEKREAEQLGLAPSVSVDETTEAGKEENEVRLL